MGQKGKPDLLLRLTNMAFNSQKSRQVFVIALLSSLILNIYLFIYPSGPSRPPTIIYDSPDHLNAAQDISYSTCQFQDKPLIMKEIEWDKLQHIHASCLCGVDNFCRCGPSPAIDIIAFTYDLDNIILVDRGKEPLGLACVGGFMELGESIEDAAEREFKEETNLEFYKDRLVQVHTFSEPHQDPRRPSLSTVFLAQIKVDAQDMKDIMQAGDDASDLILLPVSEAVEIMERKYQAKFGFDIHRTFIHEAMKKAEELDWINIQAIMDENA